MDALRTLLTDAGLDFLTPYVGWLLMTAAGLIGLAALKLVFARRAKRKRAAPVEPDLHEDLTAYPPAPGVPGPRRLTVDGLPARVRLIVVAPVGRDSNVNAEALDPMLDQIVRGLGEMVKRDQPRVRVWPAPLSNRGFAPTFHRNVARPEADGQLSQWALIAGPVKVGRWQVLLGLALWTDRPSTLGRLSVEAHEWRDTLRIQEV